MDLQFIMSNNNGSLLHGMKFLRHKLFIYLIFTIAHHKIIGYITL
jgi:hypothetical protein